MKDLASHLRYLQLQAHNSHNLCSGVTFLQDHAYFGELYGEYESAYDAVVERIIGLGGEIDLVKTQIDAAAKLPGWTDNTMAFNVLQHGETVLCRHIERLAKEQQTQGTLNLLAGLADDSEKRQYRIGQRLE